MLWMLTSEYNGVRSWGSGYLGVRDGQGGWVWICCLHGSCMAEDILLLLSKRKRLRVDILSNSGRGDSFPVLFGYAVAAVGWCEIVDTCSMIDCSLSALNGIFVLQRRSFSTCETLSALVSLLGLLLLRLFILHLLSWKTPKSL
jgi:hypothetical protein